MEKNERDLLAKRLIEDGSTVSEYAAIWGVPPWKAHAALHDMERKKIMTKGQVEREYNDGPRSVDVFVLTQEN